MLRGAVGTEKWRHIWVGCSYQCTNVVPADGRYGADGDTPGVRLSSDHFAEKDVWSLSIIWG